MRTLTFSEARSSLKDVLDRVADDADFTIITRRHAGDAVVMSLDSFNSWRETLYLLSSPANARHLAESIAQLDAGRGRPYEPIESVAKTQVAQTRSRYAAGKAKKAASNRAKKRG